MIENPTGRARVLLHGCRTDGLFSVGFRARDGHVASPAFSLVGCDEDLPANEIIARPGVTVERFSVRATYMACGEDPASQPPRTSKDWSPLCGRDRHGVRDIIPPLPAGRYRVQFSPASRWAGPRVKPASLTVTG